MARSNIVRMLAKKIRNKVGYNRSGYNWDKSVRQFHKTGQWNLVKDGSGHKAGEQWANAKGISPSDENNRYSKNSPSFDEGVYESKMKKQLKIDKAYNYDE